MIATTIEQRVAQFKQNIFMKLHHRTLLEYTGQPVVSDDELFYLLLPALNGERWSDKQDLAATGVAINLAALNTHELIEEFDATSKAQQLAVLAGDLYSGAYYAMLAEVGDVLLIRTITEAVATISEEKTKLYENAQQTMDVWLQMLTTIESDSIRHFFKHYHLEQYIPFAENGLLLNRLAEELAALSKGETTLFYKALATHHDDVEALLRQAQEMLATTYENVVSTSPLVHDDVKEWIVSRIHELKTN